jgi:hypothetical protein
MPPGAGSPDGMIQNMPFEIPENIHPLCAPLAWLLGGWRGNGQGDYPTIEKFTWGQELIFQQDGRPFFHYMGRAWITDADGNKVREGAQETGFLRCHEGGEVEFLLSHQSGISELFLGQVDGARLHLTTDAVMRTSTAKEVTESQRMYGLVEGDLWFAMDMAAVGQPLQPHLWGKLVRI